MTIPIQPSSPSGAGESREGDRSGRRSGSGELDGDARRGRIRRWTFRALGGLALVGIVAVPWWGRAVLQRLSFFHVRAIQVEGARYLDPALVVQRLEVDTLHSVWEELAPIERRVRELALVEDVAIQRELPGTLIVHLTERTPVAYVSTDSGLQAHDAMGTALPVDPLRTPLDVPVVVTPDTAVLRLLGELRVADPGLYRRLSDVRRVGDELHFSLFSIMVRTRADVNARRLADIIPVEADLARRDQRAAELDLRFRDQVIARLP